MSDKRKSKKFDCNILVRAVSSFGGALEKEGPCGNFFDGFISDSPEDDETWEKMESEMIEKTVSRLIEKSNIPEKETGLILGGDLMNQCTSSAYGLESFDIPYLGLYGACLRFKPFLYRRKTVSLSSQLRFFSSGNKSAHSNGLRCCFSRKDRCQRNGSLCKSSSSRHCNKPRNNKRFKHGSSHGKCRRRHNTQTS